MNIAWCISTCTVTCTRQYSYDFIELECFSQRGTTGHHGEQTEIYLCIWGINKLQINILFKHSKSQVAHSIQTSVHIKVRRKEENTKIMERNIDFYINWETIPVCVIAALMISAAIVVAILFFCYKEEKLMLAITNATFQNGFEIREQQYLLFGHEVHRLSLFYLGMISSTIWMFMGVSFWILFLVGTTNVCDDDLDCFAYNTSNGSYSLIQNDPIENCIDFVLEHKVEITCYRFVFDLAGATGAVGGVLVIATRFIQIQVNVLVWLYNKFNNAEKYWCKTGLEVLLFAASITPFILCYAIIVIALTIPSIQQILFDSHSHSLLVQFLCYTLTIVLCSFYGLYVIFGQKVSSFYRSFYRKFKGESKRLINS